MNRRKQNKRIKKLERQANAINIYLKDYSTITGLFKCNRGFKFVKFTRLAKGVYVTSMSFSSGIFSSGSMVEFITHASSKDDGLSVYTLYEVKESL